MQKILEHGLEWQKGGIRNMLKGKMLQVKKNPRSS